MQLFLDLDGVLADFEGGAAALLGMPSRQFEQLQGASTFWSRLADHPDFYGTLPVMADALQLVDAVRHLNPTILTGLPRGGWAEPQKRRWAAEYFPGTEVITCWSADKFRHCRPGDLLIDDQARAADRWQAAGGRFIHHIDAKSTIDHLIAAGVLDSVPT